MTAQEYFEAHTLNPEYLKSTFGVTWNDETITIPIYDEDGKLAYCKFRHLNPEHGKAKFTFEKGGQPSLFCSHKIAKHGSVVLCEGEPDCMRLWQEKIPAVTGTGGVATFSQKMVDHLKGKVVYLCLDSDKAGRSEIEKYCELLEANQITTKIVELPEDFKDISEYLTKNTKADFVQLMKDSITLEEWQEKHEPTEFVWETAKDLIKADIPQIPWLIDRILPFEGFCFIAGPEACGKSFYTLTLAESLAYKKPWLDKFNVPTAYPVLFIDKENSRATTQARLKGLGITDESEMIHRIVFPEYLQIMGEKGDYSHFIKSISRKVKKLGIKLLIIDSFTDIMVGNENARDDTQAFFDAFKQLFPGCSILVLHHINKAQAGLSRSSSEKFRGSSNITAQLYAGFLVKPVPKAINEFTIEQTKARDMTKLPEFKVNLVSVFNPTDPTKTFVSKIMYEGEVVDDDAKGLQVVEIIKELLEMNDEITRKEIDHACYEKNVSGKTIQRAIAGMREAGVLAIRKEGRKNIFYRPEMAKNDVHY